MNTSIQSFLQKVKSNPKKVQFSETISLIYDHYSFTPTAFQNGTQHNAAGENSGSCKLFAFALLHELSQEETLTCFGAYYFEEVVNNPEGTNHQNIRNFIKTGWNGIHFDGEALLPKN
jgi:hypothetical protein